MLMEIGNQREMIRVPNAPFTFELPPELAAKEPPERRGIARDEVRLLVIYRAEKSPIHTRFNHLGEFLRVGDLLVFNSSRTLPAALAGCLVNSALRVETRLAEHLPDDSWLVLLLGQTGEPFDLDLRGGMKIDFGNDLAGTIINRDTAIPRLWRMRFSQTGAQFFDTVYRIGQPVRYEYVSADWDLDYYQTVYAKEPGSSEMPSAGRAFTWKLLFDLKKRGIETASVVLHTGLSSYMDEKLDKRHPASEEEYFISDEAAAKINAARRQNRRIVAVGTTVVRALEAAALEAAADDAGFVKPIHDYTRLRIMENHRLKVVNALLTGMHEPEASHLDLLAAFLPPAEIRSAYEEAVRRKYLWHEFGDLNLII